MNDSHWNRKGALLATVMATSLLTAYGARAQNSTPPRTNIQGVPVDVQSLTTTLDTVRLEDLTRVMNFNDALVTGLRNPVEQTFGALLQPIGDTLRSQLAIPAGQGLLVSNLKNDGPSAQAGLKQNDILLSLAGKPLATVDDLTKQLKAAGEAAAPLKLLRAGKPVTIQIRPIYRVTLGPVAEQKAEYYLGVSLVGTDDAVRAQLALPAGQGLVVSDVDGGSPADKAGVKKNDIILELDGKPIESPEALAHQVQVIQDRPTTLKVLQLGKAVTIPITATMRKVEISPSAEVSILYLTNERTPLVARLAGQTLAISADNDDVRQRLDQVEKELNAVRATLDKIHETLKSGKGNKQD
jgi:C-terminal processing protease CtpA/Prc